MGKRWLSYLAVWLGCLVFFLVYRYWAGVMVFAAVSMLPPVSLLLSRQAVRSSKAVFSLPQALTRGEDARFQIQIDCKGPKPEWRAKVRLRHSFSGETKRLKNGAPLPTGHCGILHLTVRGIYLYDYLGLFRFRLAHPKQVRIPVRPEPIAPKEVPELGAKTHTRWQPRRGGGFSENHDLRLYRPGDNLQQIHWKLSAKTGNLILREPLEPLHSRLLLRLDLSGSAQVLDRKLSNLLWMSRYLLGKQLPHHWQVWTAAGIRHYFITDETTLLSSLDALLDCAPAAEGSVLDRASNAAWWYYIGGDDDEKI